MKNPIKVMLIIVIILLIASIVFNVIQARNKDKACDCDGDEAAAIPPVVIIPTV
jgi:hypothetical protein